MSGDRPRIAMVGFTFYESDGRLQRYVSNLVESGFAVDLIAVSNPRRRRLAQQSGVRLFTPMARRFTGQGRLRILWDYLLFTVLTGCRLLWNHLFSAPYSLVHINNMPNFLLLSAVPLRLAGVPVVLDMHDTMPEIFEQRYAVGREHWMVRALLLEERLCVRAADFVLTATHTERERVLTNGLTRGKSAVLLNLPDPELFPMRRLPEEPPGNEGDFRVVYHGTLAHRLGLDVAIRAMADLAGRAPEIRLEIFGDGEQREELLALRRSLGLENTVHLSGEFVPMEDLAEMLAGADLAVIPSRLNSATHLMLPVKLLEYVRLGIPCIAVPTETILHYLDRTMVALVPEEEPEALAATILSLRDDPAERLRMAREARTVLERYSLEAENLKYRNIVQSLIERRAGSADPHIYHQRDRR